MERIHTTGRSEQLKGVAVALAGWVWSLTDALPPYYIAEGQLDAKRETTGGKHLILVNGVWVSVDKPTYELLMIGEYLRVRYTRRVRAINIDRQIARNGPLA